MSSRRPYNNNRRPVVVVDNNNTKPTTSSPSSPTSSSAAPKTVRFAPTCENESSRPLTSLEAWSLYNFEIHLRQCMPCTRMMRFCEIGFGLFQDVACHVFSHNGEIWSVKKDRTHNNKFVRVEVPRGYTYLRRFLLLRSVTTPTMPPAVVMDRERERELLMRRSTTPQLPSAQHAPSPPTGRRRAVSSSSSSDKDMYLEPHDDYYYSTYRLPTPTSTPTPRYPRYATPTPTTPPFAPPVQDDHGYSNNHHDFATAAGAKRRPVSMPYPSRERQRCGGPLYYY